MRPLVHWGVGIVSAIGWCAVPALAQPGGGGGGGSGPTKCPAYLVAEFNGSYFYQEIDCATGMLLSSVTRFVSKVPSGCNGTDGCNATTPIPSLIQDEFARPETDIFVPFGRGASSHMGPAKQIVQADGKTFVLISMRLKGKTTTIGAPDNELDVIVEFGQEIDPSSNPTTKVGTLVDNTLTYDSREFTVTLMGMGAAQ